MSAGAGNRASARARKHARAATSARGKRARAATSARGKRARAATSAPKATNARQAPGPRARTGAWAELAKPATRIRTAVFTNELGIPARLDFDGRDASAIHVVLWRGRRAVAAGRLDRKGTRIGRVAVLPAWRKRGLGAEVVDRLTREAVRMGSASVCLHAQETAVSFYRRLGFKENGPSFMEAGILHFPMVRALSWLDSSAAVLLQGNRFLLGKRAEGLIMGGRWDLFGGKREAGETARMTLRRELREELSIRARIGPEIAVSLYDDPRGRGIFRCPVHLVCEWTGTVRLNEEHSEAAWFSRARVARLALAHPDIVALCRSAQAISGRTGG